MSDTDERGTSGAGLRVTSNEVDYYLQGGEQDRQTIADICRDWLDMQAERGRMLAVIAAARAVDAAFDNDEFDTTNIVVETVLLRLSHALAELTIAGAS